jgi:organic hydroperoxide reductase OsmC/OhrA
MTNSPKFFSVVSESSWGINSEIAANNSQGSLPELKLAIPPEFAGPGGAYSPEDLYALALLNCYIATFKFVAEKSKLKFNSIRGEATLEVGDSEGQKNWMKEVVLKIFLKGAEQPERALTLMAKTKDHCMIHQSVKSNIRIELFAE